MNNAYFLNMKPWTILTPIFFLAVGFAVYFLWVLNPPDAGRRSPPRGDLVINVAHAIQGDYTVRLGSQGTVRAHTESTLASEVPGRINAVSPLFRGGMFFEKGEVLIELDEQDFKTALISAEASLAQAQLKMSEEEARAKQALEDWKRLGNGEAPSSLVLREPQILEAKATVASAQSRVDQARRNLERTRIRAPYSGRVLVKNVDVGQYITPGLALGKIYAVDYAEIRLPLAEWQLAFIDLPEIRRDNSVTRVTPSVVDLKSSIGGHQYTWKGAIVRAEGSIDEASRQLFVVGQVNDPYGVDYEAPLKVGMFVEADIAGKTLKDVWIIPSEALRQGNSVLTVSEDNKLYRREVTVLWQDHDSAILSADSFAEGPRLCITPVPFAANGIDVIVAEEGPAEGGRKGMRESPPAAISENASFHSGGQVE